MIPLLTLLAACTEPETVDPIEEEEEAVDACPFDVSEDAPSAVALSQGAPVEGYVCPKTDRDWFAVDAPSGADLLEITVSLNEQLSPLELTYAVWDSNAIEIIASPRADQVADTTRPLTRVYRVPAEGAYVEVRDQGDDSSDERHPYTITVSGLSDPDSREPNDGVDAAVVTGGDWNDQGYIASHADEDWYAITTLEDGALVDFSLTMPASAVTLAYRIVSPDGEAIAEGEAVSGADANLGELQGLGAAGTYYLVVSDDDGEDIAPDVPYQLSMRLFVDPDGFEPNNTPDEATSLGLLDCSGSWSDWSALTGYLASPGDTDWYAVELGGCARGVVEVEVQFEGVEALPDDLQPSVRLVRPVEGNDCTTNQECQQLSDTCSRDIDCEMIGNDCLSSGRCGGAGFCLPEQRCGATLLSEFAPADNRARLRMSAPLVGLPSLYIALSDLGADSSLLDRSYQVRARVRTEPDTHEPNNRYTAGAPTSVDANRQNDRAVTIPVYDCTPRFVEDTGLDSGDTGGLIELPPEQCCSDSPWTSGQISYAYDQDWFRYAHPCPGEDCMVRIHYRLDGGPVDFYTQVYRGNSLWFDSIAEVQDTGMQSLIEGSFGGLEETDECFYAFNRHNNPYHFAVRDTTFRSGGEGTWDWDADQTYSFCIEKIANTCELPCMEYENGCGTP
ncbi:MAG: hypothetical protein AAFV53_03735 [Myxococcota bacterium]